jgi:hypothetical protein
MTTLKYCACCDRSLDTSAFRKNKARKSGLQDECTECMKSYQREWYLRNRERVLEKYHTQKEAGNDS